MYRVIDSEYARDLLNLEHAGLVCFLSSIFQAASAILISLKQSTYRKRWLEGNILFNFFFFSLPSNVISRQCALCLPLSVWLKSRAFSWGNCVITDGDEKMDCSFSTYTKDTVLLSLNSLHIFVLSSVGGM